VHIKKSQLAKCINFKNVIIYFRYNERIEVLNTCYSRYNKYSW